MAGLTLKHIYKVYENGHKAVNDFSIDIADKEFIVFVGPSGCGKSTTLRMVAGLEQITAGDLFIGDTLVNDMEPKDRDIAMVFQNYALYPHMSVYENMAFGLRNRKVPEAEIKELVLNAAKILGIEEYLDRKPKAMSGGQRQRVALGRAIVRNPKVFLFDEPLSNLDAKLRAQMRTEITKLHKKLATTFIYVTHDQVEAMTMGTRIVVMKLGYVQQIDTPMNLYNKPYNKFVAGFIGTPQMNFFNVTLLRKGDKVEIRFASGDVLEVPYEKVAKAPDRYLHGDVEVTFGIRPDHIAISEKKTGMNCLANVVEHLGNECLIYGDITGKSAEETETLANANQIIVKTTESPDYAPGMTFNLVIDVDKIHLFDNETEITILQDIPAVSTFPAKVVGGEALEFLGAKVKLPEALKRVLKEKGNVEIDIPADGLIEGKDFALKVHECEKIGDKNLLHLEVGDRYLFALSEKEVKAGTMLQFSLRNDKLAIRENGELIHAPIPAEVELVGRFLKSEHREGGERVIDFFYGINEGMVAAPRENGFRLNAVEGNKCYRNSYKYVIPVEKIKVNEPILIEKLTPEEEKAAAKRPIEASAGINGVVVDKLDYGNIVYDVIQVGEQKAYAIVDLDDERKEVSIAFDGADVAVHSLDIEMRIC